MPANDKAWNWLPPLPIRSAPIFVWPPRLFEAIKFLFSSTFLGSIMLPYLLLAMLTWYWLQPELARCAASGGFEPFELHEGLYPGNNVPRDHGSTKYLNKQGYPGDNPWQEYANCGEDQDGNIRSGWRLRNAIYPARVAEEHSETAFLTDRAIDFLNQQQRDTPWCLHLSYIKPHWPLIAPAPYHNMYSAADVQPVQRSDEELSNPHPVNAVFMQQEYSESFARSDVREHVIPVYMGLIRQIDDQLGRLFEHMKQTGLYEQTMIVFTSDHGDYLGDHWLGEKELFHDVSVKIPLIIANPDPTAETTRGSVCNALVEAVDLLPTLVAYAGGIVNRERVEGHSLIPLLRSTAAPEDWRSYAFSEIDYSDRGLQISLNLEPYDCRALMVRTKRWKYIHHYKFRPQLFDLQNDPQELIDLGNNPEYSRQRSKMRQFVIESRRRFKPRTGVPYAKLAGLEPGQDEARGIIIGRW